MIERDVRRVGKRMTGDARREQILTAAGAVFAEGGYEGTTTDQVARAAGVSQPYVIRLFGSKQQLFLELYQHVSTRILETFSAVPAGPDAGRMMGESYIGLVADRDLLRLLMHGFIAGSDPQIGFLAQGMLINVLIATGALEHSADELALAALCDCTIGPHRAGGTTESLGGD